MQNNKFMLLLVLSIAVFSVITTEVAVIGLLPQLESQLHVTPTQVGFLVEYLCYYCSHNRSICYFNVIEYRKKYSPYYSLHICHSTSLY